LGSKFFDDRFIELLINKYPDSDIRNFLRLNSVDKFELITNWEESKRRITSFDNDVTVRLPYELGQLLKLKRGMILLKYNDLQFIFQDILNGIIKIINEAFDENIGNTPKYCFIVGGTAENELITTAIKESIKGRVSNGIIIPPNPGRSVLIGAAYAGVDCSLVRKRRAKKNLWNRDK